MPSDLYVWARPDDLDAAGAGRLIEEWEARGGDPAGAPFEPTTEVGWFVRELLGDEPGIDLRTDAVPRTSSRPIWLETDQEAPARVAGIRLDPATAPDAVESIVSLAAKYDLRVYDARSGRLYAPLEDLAAHASATFWWGGAIQAGLAGLVGVAIAAVAFVLSIPILSGIAIVIGGFLAVMSVYSFVHEGRATLQRRGDRSG